MIKKNILSIALLSVLGLSHAAEVENLKTISFLNEPLRLHADVIGEGKVEFAAPTEYLRLNHPIPSYDLSIDVVESAGKREIVVTTTEAIDSPVLTLLLESRDSENRRQLFELPILLDFKPDPVEDLVENNSEIIIDGVKIDSNSLGAPTEVAVIGNNNVVELADIPTIKNTPEKKDTVVDTPNEAASLDQKTIKAPRKENELPKAATQDKAKAIKAIAANPVKAETKSVENSVAQTKNTPEKPLSKAEQKKLQDASDALTAENNKALVNRYGPVAAGETLWSIANKVRPLNTTPQKMIEIIKKNNPTAFTSNGVLRAKAVLIIPGETAKIQSNFVQAQESDEGKVRVGFIYELPAPPVAKVETNGEETSIKVVQPVGEQGEQTVAGSETTPSVVPVNEGNAEGNKTLETVTPVAQSGNEEIAASTVKETDTNNEADTKVKEEETIAAKEPPKKPKVFIVPDPEPEPGIVELLLENLVYIGAGAGVLILAAIIVVMQRRKKAEGGIKEPQPKKEKKVKSLGKKKKDDEDAIEAEEKPKKKGLSLFGKKKDAVSEPIEKPKTKSKGLFGKKKGKEGELEVDAVAPVAAAAATASVVESVQHDVEAPIVEDFVAEIVPEDTATSVDDLDFDLSALESVNDAPIVEDGSDDFAEDFDLSALEEVVEVDEPLAPVEEIDSSAATFENESNDVVTQATDVSELSNFDFDLSLDSLDDIKVEESTSDNEDFGNLDFDLSFSELPEEPNAAPAVVADDVGFSGLEFDLSGLESSGVEGKSPAVEVTHEAPVLKSSDEDFGENNPLFSSQSVAAKDDGVSDLTEQSDENIGESSYVSFTDLMGSAKAEADTSELASNVDFTALIDEDEAKLANLFEASAQDDTEGKLDFSFVAETDDVGASQSFLDSIDVSADKEHGADVIGDSIKDNIAMTEESMTEISNMSADETFEDASLAEPVVVEEPAIEEVTLTEPVIVEEPAIEEVTLTEPVIVEEPAIEEVTLTEPVIVEEPAIEEVTLTEPVIVEEPAIEEVTLTEPVVVEEPEIEEVTLAEPVIADEPEIEEVTLAEPAISEIVDEVSLIESPEVQAIDDVSLVAPVIEEPVVQVQEKVIEKEVIVEKVVEVEKEVIKEVEVPVVASETAEEENESEQIKLELAIAYMDFDKNLAKPLLDEVVRDGNANQAAKAADLLAQIG